ncbi:EamA family transporter [Nocardioides sp. TF02-7]|uniref:EamA family transporter n=1 Tax=Nocardioides sp. TF02-7 TaxID=2917724 RepID=UPI001F05D08C|nr:EamA family transporter [Nocardioides sp. TF02-7]UMG92005.1 DMT family transporter [Nocardioides sp. TF02-7]
MTDDIPATTPSRRTAAGLAVALLSAVSFALSGALASPLLHQGWSAGAVVLVRIGLGALVVLPFGVAALQGRWHLLRRNAGLIGLYGLLAVAGAQFCYFSAVRYLEVGPALLIEYTAPAAVVLWLWVRHGQRPGPVTVAGAVVAALGLLLVLDVVAGFGLHLGGVAWAFAAMVGAAAYFVISGDDSTGLPPISLAAGGLVVGAAVLGLLGLVGLLPMEVTGAEVEYAGVRVDWWVPLALLGLITAALAYTSGIAAARLLGSRVASFVALSEVVAAVLWAWALLGELPGLVQLLGGVLILLGVVGVKLGERSVAHAEPTPA